MAIFDEIEKTKDELVKDEARRFIAHNKKILQDLIINYKHAFWMVWNNPDVTPKEMMDALGTRGRDIFIASSDLQAFIKKMEPSFQDMVPSHEYTINEDGTVTIGEKLTPDSEPLPDPEEE